MAIHALWEDRYALSIRKGPLDLLDETTGQTSTSLYDVVSHTNAGASTNNVNGVLQYGGKGHFFKGGAVTGIGSGAKGTVIGQRNGDGTDSGDQMYGIAVTGNPDIETGQEVVEIDVQDGSSLPRLSSGQTDEDSGSTSVYRGTQTPTFNMDFIPTNKSLYSVASTFFQTGAKEVQAQLLTYSSGSGTAPSYGDTVSDSDSSSTGPVLKQTGNASSGTVIVSLTEGKDAFGTGAITGPSSFSATCSAVANDFRIKQLTTPVEGAGSSPLYYASVVRQISASGSDSRLLSDAVCNSFSLSSDQTTPLTASAGFTGRIAVTNYNTGTNSDDFTLDDGRNYLLRDCLCVITTPLKEVTITGGTGTFPTVGAKYKIGTAAYGTVVEILTAASGGSGSIQGKVLLKETAGSWKTAVASGTGTMVHDGGDSWDGDVAQGSIEEHFIMPIESFNVDCTSDVSYTYYNERFPVNMVIGGFTVDASVTIPGGGYNNRNQLRHLQELFAASGSGLSTGSSIVTPIQIGLYYDATHTGNLGDHITLPVGPADDRDLHIRLNGMITDVTTGGDNEMTTTISMSCRNSFDTSDALTTKGIAIDMVDDQTATWGYTGSTEVLY